MASLSVVAVIPIAVILSLSLSLRRRGLNVLYVNRVKFSPAARVTARYFIPVPVIRIVLMRYGTNPLTKAAPNANGRF